MKELYFHEDDYCQIELVPVENEKYVKIEIENIDTFSEEHKASDGIGWTDMYIRDDSKQLQLESYKINYLELDKILSNIADRCDKVYTGYSTYREECNNTFGYKLDEIKTYISFDNNYVTKIWFDYCICDIKDVKNLLTILIIICNDYNLLFVDWTSGFYSKIKNENGLENKLIEYNCITWK